MKRTVWLWAILLTLLAAAATWAASIDTLYLKAGDVAPPYKVLVIDENGTMDLTGTTITATMRSLETGTNRFEGITCTSTDLLNGRFEYRWADSDTTSTGAYSMQFHIQHADGQFTIPTGTDAEVVIEERY